MLVDAAQLLFQTAALVFPRTVDFLVCSTLFGQFEAEPGRRPSACNYSGLWILIAHLHPKASSHFTDLHYHTIWWGTLFVLLQGHRSILPVFFRRPRDQLSRRSCGVLCVCVCGCRHNTASPPSHRACLYESENDTKEIQYPPRLVFSFRSQPGLATISTSSAAIYSL